MKFVKICVTELTDMSHTHKHTDTLMLDLKQYLKYLDT